MDEITLKACPFFRSYHESVKNLSRDDRLDFYELILEYFFDAEKPAETTRSDVAHALFTLTKPVVEQSKTKAIAGTKGGRAKPAQSKAKTKASQDEPEEQEETAGAPECEETAAPQRESVPYKEVQKAYNEICTRLPAIKAMNNKREKQVAVLFKKYGLEGIIEIFHKANNSDFLCGGGSTGWQAGFDWLTKFDNFVKVTEDQYEQYRTNEQQNGGRSYGTHNAGGFVSYASNMYQENYQQPYPVDADQQCNSEQEGPPMIYGESWQEGGTD